MSEYFPPFLAKTGDPIASGELYTQRNYYKTTVAAFFNNVNNNYIDLWYETPFYGKINPQGRFVFPKTSRIVYPTSNDTSGNPSIKGFDFALKALEEYMFFLTRAQIAGKTGLGSLLNGFKVVSGYTDSFEAYRTLLANKIDIFRSYIVATGRQSHISDFNKFACAFVDTMEEVNEKCTFFSHFTSNKTNMSSTGLSFRFLDEDQDNDYIKNIFFQHPEFAKYLTSAATFGFRINKNSPWEIIIDVNSKPMLENRKIKRAYDPRIGKKRIVNAPGFLQEKLITEPGGLFRDYYTDTMRASYDYFKKFLIFAYDNYRKDMIYVVDHGLPYIYPAKEIKYISNREYSRTDPVNKVILDFNRTEYNNLYFIKKYERMLKIEFTNKTSDMNYATFKNNFDRATKKEKSFSKAYRLLDNYYSSLSKIHDPITKKPFWSQPKKQLTPVNSYASLQEKPQPTIGKVVTEFIPDI